jgi:signal transduction histidine kinase
MLAKSLLLFFVGSLNVIIGLAVLLRDQSKLQNRLFFLFSASLGLWVIGIGGFLITNDPHHAFMWAKAYYSFPLIVALSMPLFARSFPVNDELPIKWWLPLALGYLAVAIPVLFIHSFVTAGLVYQNWGKQIILNKPDYLLYSVYLITGLVLGQVHTYIKARHLRGTARLQAQFFFVGFLLTVVFGLIFNLILPWFGNYRLIWLGPLFTSALMIAVGYSIIRHRMFDVRLFVARSITYLASLVVLATIYGFIVFGTAQLVFGLHFSVASQILISAATGVAALSFNYFRRSFDHATNKIFYRDAYDTQEFFNKFNKILVSTFDLDELLDRIAQTIASELKAQYCLIGIRDGKKGQRIIGTQVRSFSPEEIMQVRSITPHIHQTVIVTDNITTEHERLMRILTKNDIAVLARITDSVDKEREDLGYVVLGPKRSGNPYTSQDVRVLEAAANELVIAIQNALHFEEIQNFNKTLQERVNKATSELRRTNEKLKTLDETKDEFITMASHQLRTPLTSVKGYLSMVLEGDVGNLNDQQRQLLTQSFLSSQRMVYLIADLLNLSRLNTGKFVIEPTPVDLSKVVQEEVEQLAETAKSRELQLVYNRPATFPQLMLDETKIHQVVMNLIDNAIYYTPAGGTVAVSLRETPTAIEYLVHDTGIGVPKAVQHKLFTKFYRAQNAQQARPDGTGLGLFMAKKVVVAQGGAMLFESEEGKGSTFGFRFAKRDHLVEK